MNTKGKKILSYLYMAIITVVLCYFASKIYKTDDQIWPRERYLIVATMTLSFYMTLLKLYLDKQMTIRKAIGIYHFVLVTPLILMAFPLDYYELRPMYLIPMVVVVLSNFGLGVVSGISIVIATYIMIFTNVAEFMYVALIIMVVGCISASQIGNLKRFGITSVFFWGVTYYLCGLYRYFALVQPSETFQHKFAGIGLMVAVASSIVIFVVKYWIFFIRIHMFASEKSLPMQDMKEYAISLYYHSVEVGGMSKSAAAAIGADIRLAYAAGLLHDIGKMKNSQDIRTHLKVANEYGLPRNIKAIIVECSGKHRKPITKESGIVMLADSVVTSLEYLRESGKDIAEEKVIDNVFATRVNNGSLSKSGLTLEDLYIIKQVFLKKQ